MEKLVIESKKNATLSLVRSLNEKKYRKEHGLFFLEGETLFFEARAAGLVPRIVVLSASASRPLFSAVEESVSSLDTKLCIVTQDLYCSVSAEQAPQGVLGVFSVEDFLSLTHARGSAHTRYVILEKIRDPGNVGAILRSAAAFGYRGAVFVDCADLFNPKTLRASMGALFGLELFVYPTLEGALSFVREHGLCLYGTSPHAKRFIRDADWKRPFALLFGNEGAGATEEALSSCDEVLAIPMESMESLNAACACAVALYESARG